MLRCLSGRDWGASRASLINIYQALMRTASDYGCLVYMSASETNLKKLDVEQAQAQALRICTRAFKTSPVTAIQVEAGEMPLSIRRVKIILAYWTNLQGHSMVHPTKTVLQECAEHSKSNIYSLGWVGNAKAQNAGLNQLQIGPTVATSIIPPWKFIKPSVNIRLQQILKENSK